MARFNLQNYLWSILPVGTFGMLYLATMAWLFPESAQGIQFLNSAGALFEMEFVFMHSAIFFQMRNNLKKNIVLYWAIALILVLVYGLFIQNLAKNDSQMWVHYLFLTAGRILFPVPEKVPNFLKQKLGVNLETYQNFAWVGSLLKAGGFLLLIPLVIFLLPLPDFGLSESKVDEIVKAPHRSRDLIQLVQVFWIFYFIQCVLSIRSSYFYLSESVTQRKRM